VKTFLRYVRPSTLMILIGLTIKFIATICDLVIPSVLATLIDDVAPTGNTAAVWRWGALMFGVTVLAVVTNISANFMAAHTAGRITRALRRDLFEKISSLSSRQIDSFTVPSLISRMTSDTYNVSQMAAKLQRIGFRAPVILIGGIIVTLFLDPVLTLMLLACLPAIAVIVFLVTKYGIPMYTRVQDTVDKLVRCVQENLTGVRVIKALSRTEHERTRFRNINEDLAAKEQTAGLIMNASSPATTLILNLGLCLIVIVGANRVHGGMTEPGTVIAFLSYFTMVLNGMIGITNVFAFTSKGIASSNRIAEVLNCTEDMPVLPGSEIIGSSHIAFDNVTFSYSRTETRESDNINALSFSLERGDTLGIIGTTGSGKSTLISLLLRLYDPDEGVIRIDGEDIRTLPPEELRPKFGMVFQNDFILSDTLRENVSFGRDIPDERILEALRDAQATEFVSQLSDGLDHMLTAGGTNVSGGQRQRILLARALAACPEILILDDSSSALDYKTDANLRRALFENYPESTKIIVAQRVSSIMHADLILVMDDGEVIARGRHEELMATSDEYRNIAETQLGGEEK